MAAAQNKLTSPSPCIFTTQEEQDRDQIELAKIREDYKIRVEKYLQEIKDEKAAADIAFHKRLHANDVDYTNKCRECGRDPIHFECTCNK